MRDSAPAGSKSDPSSTRRGVLLGIGAYGLWGLLPLYFAAITEVPPAEVFAHRALWSFLLLAVIVAVARRWRDLALSLRRGKAVVAVTASAVLIAANRLSARSTRALAWYNELRRSQRRPFALSLLCITRNLLMNPHIPIKFPSERERIQSDVESQRQWTASERITAVFDLVKVLAELGTAGGRATEQLAVHERRKQQWCEAMKEFIAKHVDGTHAW